MCGLPEEWEMARARELIARLNEKMEPIKHCRTCKITANNDEYDDECPQCGGLMEVIGANSLGGIKGGNVGYSQGAM